MTPRAFQELHDGCRAKVLSGIRGYVRNHDEAEDVTASAFVTAFQKRKTFLAFTAGIHSAPKLGIFLHPLDKLRSGFHGHPLAGRCGTEVNGLKSFRYQPLLPRPALGCLPLIRRPPAGGA